MPGASLESLVIGNSNLAVKSRRGEGSLVFILVWNWGLISISMGCCCTPM